MEQDGAWGDHVILCAAANCYKTCIRVVSSLNAAHDVILRPQCPVDESRTLALGHIHEVHYVSLHSTQAKQTELQEMETRPTNLQGQPRGKEKQLQAKERQNLSLQTLCNTTNQPMEEEIRQEENLYLIRLRAVEEQLAHCQGQLKEKELEQANLLREKEQQHQKLTNLQGQLREKELLKNSMQEQLNRKVQQVGNLEEQLKTKDRERIKIERSLSAARSVLRVHRAQVVTLERQLITKDQEKHELERTLAAAQRVLRAENQAQNLPDWVIPRNQIQLTEKILGRGAWGEVVEGKYCGYAVAVKR
ncbi:trichohyalin-like, partial [Stylophora pistillata]|uniref:trichohyalin-like n=1 Tax=Stylophora pistillata TaxID=50429 RepID=UPI000C039DF2